MLLSEEHGLESWTVPWAQIILTISENVEGLVRVEAASNTEAGQSNPVCHRPLVAWVQQPIVHLKISWYSQDYKLSGTTGGARARQIKILTEHHWECLEAPSGTWSFTAINWKRRENILHNSRPNVCWWWWIRCDGYRELRCMNYGYHCIHCGNLSCYYDSTCRGPV